MVIGLRSHHVTKKEYFIPKGQHTVFGANQMRRLPNGNIEVRTLWKHAKPTIKEFTNQEFDNWQASVDRLA